METSSDFGLDSATRAVLQDHLDEYMRETGEPELAVQPPRPDPRHWGAAGTGNVIDFRRAKLHLEAARSMDAAAEDAPMRTAETLRQLAEDFRERARGYPPMRG